MVVTARATKTGWVYRLAAAAIADCATWWDDHPQPEPDGKRLLAPALIAIRFHPQIFQCVKRSAEASKIPAASVAPTMRHRSSGQSPLAQDLVSIAIAFPQQTDLLKRQ